MASRNPEADADMPVTPAEPEPLDTALTYREPEWETTRSVDRRADLSVGDRVTFSKQVVEEDVVTFAHTSGDTNRLHLDSQFADGTRFGGRIVHGMLVSGLISAALARLPGVTVYLSQDTSFRAPAELGQRFTAECEIVEDLGEWRFRISTVVTDESGTELVDGEAVVLIDELPGEADHEADETA